MRIAFPIIFLFIVAAAGNAQSPPQAITDAFERSITNRVSTDTSGGAPRYLDFFSNAEVGAISFYQKDIGSQSVGRCPFAVSCSRFAVESIKEKGPFIGVCLFLDRYFYRENGEAYAHYELMQTRNGLIKLDDALR